MGIRKGKLFELASTFKTYSKKATKGQRVSEERKEKSNVKKVTRERGQHFDEGKSITLSYEPEEFGKEVTVSRGDHVTAMGIPALDHSEAFYVEPFDAEEFVEAPYREVEGSPEDERLEKIVTGFSKHSDEHEDLKDDEEQLGALEEKIDKMFEPEDDDDDSKAMEFDQPKGSDEKKDSHSGTQPVIDGDATQHMIYNASDEEFAKDIGAILHGQKVYDAQQKKTVGRSTDAPVANAKKEDLVTKSTGPKDDLLDPNKNEHRIFEKIAQSMTYANSYDLGAIALEEKFQLMDDEIQKEEVNSILVKKPGAEPENNIQDADVVEEKKAVEGMAMGMEGGKFHPHAPLDHLNGGRLVGVDQLQKGDLILSSSTGSAGMMGGSQECIGGLYVGGGKVLTRGDGGALGLRTLDADPSGKGVIVVLRHQNITSEKGSAIADNLAGLRVQPDQSQAENWVKISCPSIVPHPEVCHSSEDKKKCNAFAGKIFLGTPGNDSFIIAESIVNAFEKSQIGFVPPLTKDHNGSLRYFGHLKNKS